MKRTLLLSAILVTVIALAACGSSTSSTSTTSELSDIEGTTDVPVGNSFNYTFSREVNTDTVSTTTFFMVATPTSNIAAQNKGTYNVSTCIVANAIAAVVTCSTGLSCTLTPANNLSYSTAYTACLTTDIQYADGTAFEGASIGFTTAAATADAPTVSALIDANSQTVATSGTTGVYPTSFAIYFSETMDDTSVTTEGNITMSCVYGENDVLTPTISVVSASASSSIDIYATSPVTVSPHTVTVTDAWKYALMTCTLTMTTNITNSSGTALAAAAPFVFTNACAVNDDFNVDSQTCWPNVYDQSDWTTWETLLANALTFDTANSTLDVLNTTENYTIGVYKEAGVASSGFSIITHFGANTILGDNGYYYAQLNDTTDQTGEYLTVGLHNDGTATNCLVMYDNGTGQGDIRATHDCSSLAAPYVKLSATEDKWEMQYSEDGTNWSDYTDAEMGTETNPYSWPTSSTALVEGLSTPYLWIYAIGISTTDAKLDSVATSGITVTDQY